MHYSQLPSETFCDLFIYLDWKHWHATENLLQKLSEENVDLC